jgi:hypothetical protein
MILMALQQVTSPGFNTPRHHRKCLPARQQMSFRGRDRQLARKGTIIVLFTSKKLIAFDVLPKGSTFNQRYFMKNIFPDLKTAKLNFWRQKTVPTFWEHMDNSVCHGGSKIMSKIQKNHIFRNVAPALFPRYTPGRFFALWDVNADPERPRVFLK